MEIHALILSILLLSLLTGSEGKSLDQSFSCAKECYVGSEVGFRSNKEYSYLYLADIESSFHTESAGDQKSRLSIQANIKIKAKSSCDLVLSVEDIISIDGTSPRGRREIEWERAITANPLPFSWQNGKIESLCPSDEDPVWVLNFKRGVLSALQVSSLTSESAVKELDVSGDCEANYVVEPGRRTTEITKLKDYTKCINRDRHMMFSYFIQYQSTSPRQNFIHSSQNCRQTLSGMDIQSVDCTEEHVFRPFSTEESGARTKIIQKLTLNSQRMLSSSSMNLGNFQRRTTLEFEVEPKEAMMNQERARQSAFDLMDTICSTMDMENYDAVGKQFISLVFSLRHLDTDSIGALYSHLDTCTEWRSSLMEMFVDALPFCGTESCVEFTSSLIMRDEVKRSVAERWLNGFSFISNPTPKMVSSLMEIVEDRKFPEISFLAVGTMIHRICTSDDKTNCMNDNSIRTSLQVLEQHLGANCHSSNPENYKMILLALRSLGNAGRTTSHSTISRCITEEDNEMEIRVAAAQTYRRMPCTEDRSVLLNTLFSEEDSELRISSYIALMQCPTSELVSKVKNLLETEHNMQVASFIWTHLTQVMESDDPLKSFVQTILAGHTFKEYNLDPRKYSQYHEASLFSERMNAGATVEGNLIWSPKSFIPRSASVNITVDLFGQAVNLFEIGGRVQGFEKYLQSYLEPKAFEKRESRQTIHETLSPKVQGISRRYEEKVSKGDEPKASMFFRMFGNELFYTNSDMMSAEAEERRSNIIADFAAKFMSEEGYNYHDDSLLMNSKHILPTGIGMPLEVGFNGSTTVDVHAAGNFNFQGLLANTPEYLIRGKVVPRAAVVIMGSMTVDARVKKTGIATESKMIAHSSLDGFAKVHNGGNSFVFELNSPFSKNINFEFNHKLLTVNDDNLQDFNTRERYPKVNEVSYCSDEFLGQRFCFNQHYVSDRYSNGATANPIFPMDGPLEVSACMQKTDSSIMKYTITGNKRNVYESPEDSIPSELVMSVEFNTPGSTVDRRTGINLSYNMPKRIFFVKAVQAGKTYKIQGEYNTGPTSSSVSLSADMNGSPYSFDAMYEKMMLDGETRWATEIECKIPEKTMTAQGKIILNPSRKLQADLLVQNVLDQPIVMKLDLQDKTQSNRNKLSYSGAGEMSALPYVNTGFSFEMNLKPKLNNMQLDLQYKIGEKATERILLHHKRTNVGSKSETDWKLDHSLRCTQFPMLNHEIVVSYLSSATVTKTNVALGYGSQIDDERNPYKLEYIQEFTDLSSGSTSHLNGLVSLSVPYMRVNRKVTLEHLYNENQLHTTFTTQVGNGSPSVFNLLWKNNQPDSEMMDRTIEAEFPTPYGRMVFTDTTRETSANIFVSHSELSLGEANENSFSRDTTIKNLPDTKSIEMSVSKGDGSKVIDMSNVNKVEENSVYSSENNIHVVGYAPRGLNIIHRNIQSAGYPTSIEYLKSNIVQVGAQFEYHNLGAEKYITLALQQNQVVQRTVALKSGYVYPDKNNFRVYFNIEENSTPIVKYEMEYIRDASKEIAGSFSVDFMETLSEENSNMYTKVSLQLDPRIQASVTHRCKDKNAEITMYVYDNTVSGTIQHNFCDYANDASYTLSKRDNAVTASLTVDRTRAELQLSKLSNELRATFRHNVRDLYKLEVPSRASASISRSAADDSNKQVSMNMQVDEKSFSWTGTFTDLTAGRDILNAKLSSVYTNSLLPALSEGCSSDIEMMVRQNRLIVKLTKDREALTITMVKNFPKSASIVFTQNISYLVSANVPSDVSLSYNFKKSPNSWEVKYASDDKSISAKGLYETNHIQGEWTNGIISSIPQELSLDISGQFSDRPWEMTVKTTYNDQAYTFNIAESYGQEATTPLIPFIKTNGYYNIVFKALKNTENIFQLETMHESRADYFGYNVELRQSAFTDYPSRIYQKERVTITDDKYVYSLDKEFDEKYVKEEINMDFSRNLYDFTYQENMDRPHRLHVSVQKQANSATLTAEHNYADLEEYIPMSVTGNVNWDTSGSVKRAGINYNWGDHPSNGNLQWDSKYTDVRAEFSSPVHGIHYNFNYTITENSISINEMLSYDDKVYGWHMDGEYKVSETPISGQVNFNANLILDDKSASTANIVGLDVDTKTLFVSTQNKQTLCDQLPHNFNFAKNFTWDFGEMSFDIEITDANGEVMTINGNMVREGTSIVMELNHNQDSWTDVLAKHVAVKVSTDCTDDHHVVTLALTEDEVTKAITGTVTLLKSDSQILFNTTARHDFDYLSSEFNIPKQMGFEMDGRMSETEKSLSTDMVYGDMKMDEVFRITHASDNSVSIEDSFFQNISPVLPSRIRTTADFTKTETGGTIEINSQVGRDSYAGSATLSSTSAGTVLTIRVTVPEFEPATAEFSWTGRIGSLTYNIPSLTMAPKYLTLKMEPNEEMSGLDFSIETNEYNRRLKLQRASMAGVIEVAIHQDFDLLSEYNIPNDIGLKVVVSPSYSLKLTLDDKSLSIEKTDKTLTMAQNMIETFPKNIELMCNCDLQSQRKVLDMQCNVDSVPYQIYLLSDVNFAETGEGKMEIQGKLVMDQKRVTLNNVLDMSDMRKSLDFSVSQTITEELPPTVTWNSVLTKSGNGGAISVTASHSDEPIKVDIDYTQVSDMHYRATVVHNQESISETIPLSFQADASFTGSTSRGTVEASIRSAGVTRPFTISYTNTYENRLDFSVTINHNFDILESNLMIPKSVEFSLSGTSLDATTSLEYEINSDSKSISLHYDYQDSQFHANLDQNIFEEQSGRRSAMGFPRKITFTVGRSDEGGFILKMTSKAGKKRRYFNMEYLKTEGESNKTWKFDMAHNLNRMLPMEMPTNINAMVNTTPSSFDVEMGYNNIKYGFSAWKKEDVKSHAVGFVVTHTDSSLSRQDVPNEISWMGKRDKNDGSLLTQLTYDGVVSTFGISGIDLENAKGVNFNFTTSAQEEPITISAKIMAQKEDGEYLVSATGNQNGLDEYLPKNFRALVGAKYVNEQRILTLRSSQNIPLLKTYEIPYETEFTIGATLDLSEKTFTGKLGMQADDIFYSLHTVNAGLDEKSLTFMGERTKDIWSANRDQQLTYRGKISDNSEENMVNWRYTLSEYNMDRRLMRNDVVSLNAEMTDDAITWDHVAEVEMLNELGYPTGNEGSLTYGSDTTVLSVDVTYVDGSVLKISMNRQPENFKFSSSYKGEHVTLQYTETDGRELTFEQNLKAEFAKYIPTRVHATHNDESLDITVDSAMMNFATSAQANSYDISLKVTDIGTVVASSGRYITRPSYKISGNLQMPTLKIDYDMSSEMQFFKPGNGKSMMKFSLTDNRMDQSFVLLAHMQLVESSFFNMDTGFSGTSTIPSFPVNFEFAFVTNSEPSSLKLLGKVDQYSMEINVMERSFKIESTMPESFPLYHLLFTGTCEGSVQTRLDTVMTLQWNNESPVHMELNTAVMANSHDVTVEFRHPFPEIFMFSVRNIHYTMRKENGQYIIHCTDQMDDITTNSDIIYSVEDQGRFTKHSLTVDLQNWFPLKSFFPRHLLTTGVITYGENYYDSQWKFTSNDESTIIFNKQYKCNSENNCDWTMLWNSPHDEFPVKMFTVNGNVQIESNRYTITNDVRYNDKPNQHSEITYTENTRRQVTTRTLNVDLQHPFEITNIPKHFVTNGKITTSKNLYDSKWKITSEVMDPLIMEKQFKSTDDGYHMSMLWKQPVEEFPLTYFSSTVDLQKTTSDIKFIGDWQYNSEPKLEAAYNWTSPNNGKTVNSSIALSVGEEKFYSSWFYSIKGKESTGKKLVISYYNILPTSFATDFGLPKERWFDQTIFWRNKNAHVQTRYHDNMMDSPLNIDFLYVMQNGNQLFDSSVEVRYGDDTSGAADLEVKFNIDMVGGVTLSISVPSMDMDKSVNVKYVKSDNTIILTYTAAGQEPEIINIKLGEILPKFKALWSSLQSSDIIPRIKFIRDAAHTDDMHDFYIGLQVKDTPYTIHFITGVEVKNLYFMVVTKENFVQNDEILRVDASLPTPENLQLQIRANKRLSAILRIMMSSCNSELKEKVTVMADLLRDFLVSMKRVVDGSRTVENTINDSVNEWVSFVDEVEMKLHEIIQDVNDNAYNTILESDESMEITVRKVIEMLSRIVEQIRSVVNKPLQQLKQDYLNEISSQILHIITPYLQPITRLMNQVHAGQLFLELVQEGVTKFIYLMDRNLEAILNAAKKPAAELMYISDNQVIINIPLSFSVKDLVSLPSMSDITVWIAQSSLAHEIDEKLKILYKVTEYYYQYRSVLNMPLDEIIPPFKGHAEMTGFRHFHTFDGRRYDYSSNCGSSHILAHDFRNNEFTVLLNYGERPSITVMSVDSEGRRNTVVLNQDYTVTDEEGRTTPLPMEYGDMTVIRSGDVITATTALGLTVACNFETELCTIDVSPFYFAGIAGMAGKFNNEPYDDFEGPESVAENSETLAQSWMTPGGCSAHNTYTECTRPTSRACTQLFEDKKSMLYSCFPVIDPEPYLNMCAQDTCGRNAGSNLCGSAASYARQCKLRGVDLPMPESCVQCDSASGSRFQSSQEISVSGADVVFVVEKSGCMRIRKKDYKKLLNNIHTQLNNTLASGNMKYAVVGFGGPRDLAQPHSITLHNDIFMQTGRELSSGNERELLSALKRGEKTRAESDVLEALQYAAQLPFRAGASRTIILLTCDECTNPSSVKASSVKNLLRQQGIIVHQLRQKNIQSGGKKVYGFNQGQVFAKNSNDDLSRSSLKISGQDQCLPLVDMTAGSVWSANTLNRESIEFIGNEVTSGVNAVPRQSCVCTLNSNNTPIAKCSAA